MAFSSRALSSGLTAAPARAAQKQVALEKAPVHGTSFRELPEGWEERKDAYGRTFYYNSLVKQSCWRRPKQVILPRRFRSNCARLDLFITQCENKRHQEESRTTEVSQKSHELSSKSTSRIPAPRSRKKGQSRSTSRGFYPSILNSNIKVTLRSDEDSIKLLKAIYMQEVEDAGFRDPMGEASLPGMAVVSRLVRQENVPEENYHKFVRSLMNEKSRTDVGGCSDNVPCLLKTPGNDGSVGFAEEGSRKAQRYKDDLQHKLDRAKKLRELKGTKAGRLEQVRKDQSIYYDAHTNTFKGIKPRRRTSSLIVQSKRNQRASMDISEIFTIPVRSLTPTSTSLRGTDSYFGLDSFKVITPAESKEETRSLEQRLRFADKLSILETSQVDTALSSYLTKNTTASYVLSSAEKQILGRDKRVGPLSGNPGMQQFLEQSREVFLAIDHSNERKEDKGLPCSPSPQVISSSEIEQYIDRLSAAPDSPCETRNKEQKESEGFLRTECASALEDQLREEQKNHAETRKVLHSLQEELHVSRSTCRELVQTCDFLTIESGKALTSFKSQQDILGEENKRLTNRVNELQEMLNEFGFERSKSVESPIKGYGYGESQLSRDRLVRIKMQLDKIHVLESVVANLERENTELEKLKQIQSLEIRTLQKNNGNTPARMQSSLPVLKELQHKRLLYLESQVQDFQRALKNSCAEGRANERVLIELKKRYSSLSDEHCRTKAELQALRKTHEGFKRLAETQKLESEELLQKQFATLHREQCVKTTKLKEELNERLFRASRKASLALSSAVQQVKSELTIQVENGRRENRALVKRLQKMQEAELQQKEQFGVSLQDKDSVISQIENELNNTIVGREVDLMSLKRANAIRLIVGHSTQVKRRFMREALRRWTKVSADLKCEEIIEVYGSALDRTSAVHNLFRVLEHWKALRLRQAFGRIREHKKLFNRQAASSPADISVSATKTRAQVTRTHTTDFTVRLAGRKYCAPRPGAHFLLSAGIRLSRIENMIEKNRLFRLHKSWMKLKMFGVSTPAVRHAYSHESHFKMNLKSHALREEIRALHDQLASAKAEAWSYKRKLITRFESKASEGILVRRCQWEGPCG